MQVSLKKVLKTYQHFVIVALLTVIALRITEVLGIYRNYGLDQVHAGKELAGLLLDLIFSATLLAFCFPLYATLLKVSKRIANTICIGGLSMLAMAHLAILKYFIYQLLPLDMFLYQYTTNEILFTIRTSDAGVTTSLIAIISCPILISFLFWYISKKRIPTVISKSLMGFLVLSVPVWLYLYFTGTLPKDKFSINKSTFFYSQSLVYFTQQKITSSNLSTGQINKFHQWRPHRQFTSNQYPLLHHFDTINPLQNYFSSFDTTPNIVVLIVEGLNDDFINDYHGATLMPFLHDLSSKSLYWDHCFTLGERSFAAVPSLIGSLPYGKIGFTLEDKLPRHLSLVSILKSRGYFTSFFYGQASWFHLKNRFFQFNDIDLIFDKHHFTDKYEKIIVGADQFFFGYNDKDLFSQSLEVLDTLPTSPRLDTYFTGTSHSPFIIPEEEHYNEKYDALINELPDNSQSFFHTYRKNLKTVLFADDALQDFFKKYSTRPDFANTIFVITGDHPMTEVPISNALKRYHVPMIIYSPKLQSPQKFEHTVSHLDLYETILSLLRPYVDDLPTMSAAMGGNLLTQNPTSNAHYAFMNDNREIIDYYSNGYYIGGGQLFKVNNDLSIQEINDEDKMQQLHSELDVFKKVNHYVCSGNKIITDSLYCSALNHQLIYTNKNSPDNAAFQSEYFELIPPIKMSNKGFTMDIGFHYENVSEQDVALVYQLTNKDDSIVYWKSTAFAKDKKFLQGHYVVPAQPLPDSSLTFKAFIWNKTKAACNIKDIDLLIHRPLEH